jgi:polyhydroxybutyrate depolymerase
MTFYVVMKSVRLIYYLNWDEQMRSRIFWIIAIGVITSCDSTPAELGPTVINGTGDSSIDWDGESRSYQLYVPSSYDQNQSAPLVLGFHGQTSDAKNMQQHTDLDAAATAGGFLVAYLDDLVGDWAEGCNCAKADALNVDDVGFALAVIEEVSAEYNIDPSRLYAVGFSLGGLFVQRLACEKSDIFEGVVSVASTMSATLAANCSPTTSIDLAVVLGSSDPVFPWAGTNAGIFSVLSADSTVSEWIVNNGCAEHPLQSQSMLGSRTLNTSSYETCEGGGSVFLHRIEEGIHAWYPGTGELVGAIIRKSNQ